MTPTKRRTLKVLGATLGASAFAYAVEPLRAFTQNITLDQFLQGHFKELTPEQLEVTLARLEQETKDRHGRDVTIRADPAIEGVEFGYGLNLSTAWGVANAPKLVTWRTITIGPPTTPTFACWR